MESNGISFFDLPDELRKIIWSETRRLLIPSRKVRLSRDTSNVKEIIIDTLVDGSCKISGIYVMHVPVEVEGMAVEVGRHAVLMLDNAGLSEAVKTHRNLLASISPRGFPFVVPIDLESRNQHLAFTTHFSLEPKDVCVWPGQTPIIGLEVMNVRFDNSVPYTIPYWHEIFVDMTERRYSVPELLPWWWEDMVPLDHSTIDLAISAGRFRARVKNKYFVRDHECLQDVWFPATPLVKRLDEVRHKYGMRGPSYTYAEDW